jgi:hypothetical protein
LLTKAILPVRRDAEFPLVCGIPSTSAVDGALKFEAVQPRTSTRNPTVNGLGSSGNQEMVIGDLACIKCLADATRD